MDIKSFNELFVNYVVLNLMFCIYNDKKQVKCITYKLNSLRAILRKDLVSKFLHHTIALDSHNDQIKNANFLNETSPVSFI